MSSLRLFDIQIQKKSCRIYLFLFMRIAFKRIFRKNSAISITRRCEK